MTPASQYAPGRRGSDGIPLTSHVRNNTSVYTNLAIRFQERELALTSIQHGEIHDWYRSSMLGPKY